jgi:GNAT superfamily N-acetyltransferase
MTSSPFSTGTIELPRAGDGSVHLRPFEPRLAQPLAEAIAAMEPWSVMNYPADKLADFLANPDAGVCRHIVSLDGTDAGVVSVRSPWLKGPYLEILALLPHAQGQGIGRSIMAWLEATAVARDARNLWVCASTYNVRGLAFYARHGFVAAAVLPGLVADGYDEILLRKFLLQAEG